MCRKAPFRGVNEIVGDLITAKVTVINSRLLILVHLGIFIAMRISSN